MTKLIFELPVVDEACSDGDGQFALESYHSFVQPRIILKASTLLGSQRLTDGEEIIDRADKIIRKQFEGASVAGAVVLRICNRHEKPRFEVESRVVAGTQKSVLDEGESRPNPDGVTPVTSMGVYLDDVERARASVNEHYTKTVIQSSQRRILYLPRMDYSGISQPHDGVAVERGGNSPRVDVGLLGGEILVDAPKLPPAVDMR